MQNKKETRIKVASKSYFYFKNDYDTDDDSAKADVSEFIIHPDWDSKDTHFAADIAIAVLKEPIKLSNEIKHVCLNTPADPIQSFAGSNAKVYGWGFTEDFEYDTRLRDVQVPLVDQALCNSSDVRVERLMSDTSFCAGARDGKTGACFGNVADYCSIHLLKYKMIKYKIFSGDSGGGLVMKVASGLWKIIGIVSAGNTKTVEVDGEAKLTCDLDVYSIYSDVSKSYNWIFQVILET